MGNPGMALRKRRFLTGMELSLLGCVGEIKEPIQRGTWIQDFILARRGDHLSKNLKVRARVTGRERWELFLA